MTAAEIADRIASKKRQFEAGNIGLRNYQREIVAVFQLVEELARNVSVLEQPKENSNG